MTGIRFGLGLGGLVSPAAANGPTPAQLAETFLAGETGFYYDLLQGASLWQDTSATTAAGIGDPVGRADDFGAGGNNVTQASGAARPVRVANGAQGNGSSMFMETSVPILPDGGVTEGTLIAQITALSGTSNEIVMGVNQAAGGRFYISINPSGYVSAGIGNISYTTAQNAAANTGSGDLTGVLSITYNASEFVAYWNGVSFYTGSPSWGTVSAIPVYLFSQNYSQTPGAANFFSGIIHRAGAVQRALTDTEVAYFSDTWSEAA